VKIPLLFVLRDMQFCNAHRLQLATVQNALAVQVAS
jgi:hypothetical protein